MDKTIQQKIEGESVWLVYFEQDCLTNWIVIGADTKEYAAEQVIKHEENKGNSYEKDELYVTEHEPIIC